MQKSMTFEPRKGVALFGGGPAEKIGFIEIVRANVGGFEIVDMVEHRNVDNQSAAAADLVDVSQVAVILVETTTSSEVARIGQLMQALAPRAVILAVRDQSVILHPMEWPANLRGILNWGAICDHLGHSLRLISDGLVVFDPKVTDMSTGTENAHITILQPENLAIIASITHREDEVASEICDGAQNRSIAITLGISVNTVNTHVNSLIRKLGVTNRTEIAIWYLKFIK